MPHSATVSWAASPDLTNPPAAGTGYNIYRSQTSGAEAAPALNPALITSLSFVDSTVLGGQTYDYVVTAVNSSGVESVHSSEIQAKVPLSPPEGLSVVVV